MRRVFGGMRRGTRDNPTMQHLAALAGFFGVSPAYFFDDEIAAGTDAKLSEVVAALREAGIEESRWQDLQDTGVKRVAVRAAGLSPQGLRAAEAILHNLRATEAYLIQARTDRGETPTIDRSIRLTSEPMRSATAQTIEGHRPPCSERPKTSLRAVVEKSVLRSSIAGLSFLLRAASWISCQWSLCWMCPGPVIPPC
jgi:transcriptional regulator with XRE-family HTH domain